MVRFLLRAIGLLILAGAFAAAIVDGTRSIAANAVVFTTLGDAFNALAPDRLAALQAAVGRVHPWIRDVGVFGVLLMPLWLAAALVGGALLALTRRAAPRIGFSSR